MQEVLGADFFFSDCLRTKRATIRDVLAHRLGVASNNYARMQDDFTRKKLARYTRPYK